MDKRKDKLIEFKKKYLPLIIKKYKPKEVILFGSTARGEALKDSDLDIIIVSDAFKGIRFIERPYIVTKECKIFIGMDLLCYTEEEFKEKKKELCIVQQAIKEGISLI